MEVKHNDIVTLLFVYGTLKRGYGNNRLLATAEFVAEDWAPGKLYGGYVPVVAPLNAEEPVAHWVNGEVFLVDIETLRRCDQLEGHPHGYLRTLVTLRSGTKAFIYYWPHSVDKRDLVESGVWQR